MQGTRGEQRGPEPADEVLVTPMPIREWFLRPPYPGTLLSLVLVGLLVAGGIMVGRQPQTSPEPPQVAFTPSVVSPERDEQSRDEKPKEDEAPLVLIRPVPGKEAPPMEKPEVKTQTLPEESSNVPLDGSIPPVTLPAAPGQPSVAPDGVPSPADIPLDTSPLESPRTAVPPVEVPAPEPARPEPVEPIVPREEAPRPRPRRPAAPAPPVRRAQPTGRMTVYFDADSSTFDRRDERLPLRVQVYVDGQRRLDSADPEKREFDLGDLPEGRHEVVLVPFVGRNQPEPRRFQVDIDAASDNRFKAVLRREDGMSRIAKFRPRD